MMRGSDARKKSRARRKGFTLIELSIVMLIIGILMGFILAASYEGVQRAQMRATQALIAKLDTGVNFRLDDLLSRQVEPNGAHQFMAAIFPALPANTPPNHAARVWGIPSDKRAQVIALHDYIKRELPDVFYYNPDTTTNSHFDAQYPLNFAGLPYPAGSAGVRANYLLPLGHMSTMYSYGQYDSAGNPLFPGPGAGFPTPGFSEGIYGASYAAAAGIYKNLGYLPAGYDGADSDGDGFIDNRSEGVYSNTGAEIPVDDPDNPGTMINLSALVNRRLGNHTHKTARSEMLYALLVEGQGSRGAVFRREDFAEKDIADTDHDGLPEFVDAWGEPIQFFRWPVYHFEPGLQQGTVSYAGVTSPRDHSSIDPNDQLVAPAWWSAGTNTGSTYIKNDPFAGAAPGGSPASGMSGRAFGFQYYFLPLIDYASQAGGAPSTLGQGWWDMGHNYRRRAYFSKHLIVSAGPDKKLGIGMTGINYATEYEAPVSLTPVPLVSENLIQIENTASTDTPYRNSNPPYYDAQTSGDAATITNEILGGSVDGNGNRLYDSGWKLDDISNQGLSTAAGGIQ